LRQSQARTLKLENDVRQQTESVAIALETAHRPMPQRSIAAIISSNSSSRRSTSFL
jgi:hypothetical protein